MKYENLTKAAHGEKNKIIEASKEIKSALYAKSSAILKNVQASMFGKEKK